MAAASGKAALLSEHTRHEIDHWISKFPPGRQRSAVITALHAAQEQNQGHLTIELMDAVAEYLQLPPVQVYEVASFYSMLETHKCGRQKLGIREGESTADGRIFLKREEECLAGCTGAPMMMVDHVYHENLTPEAVDRVLDDLK
jgi:NADH-quinone oxidoreductase subunit E